MLRSSLLILLISALSLTFSGVPDPCKSDGPLLTDEVGKPIWLTPSELIKSAAHCVAPHMPPLTRQAEIDGYVYVDILVDEKGHVACVRLINGHPLLASSAIDAARSWVFQPKKQKGQGVSFYGHLRFHFSTEPIAENENPMHSCTLVVIPRARGHRPDRHDESQIDRPASILHEPGRCKRIPRSLRSRLAVASRFRKLGVAGRIVAGRSRA